MSRLLWVSLFAAVAALPVSAQVVYPKPPDEFAATIRYRIRAAGDQRVVPFQAMLKHLKAVGFKPADEERFKLDLLDPGAELVSGTLPSAAVGKLFDDPNIKTAVLAPVGGKAFDDPKKVLQLRLELSRGLPAEEQQMLHGQAVEQLAKLGFVHATGYDHRGFTRVRGSLAAEAVPQLVKDLRSLPGGWFIGASDRISQPMPFRLVLPVRTVEVLPDLPVADPVAAPADLGKLTADLKAVVDDPANADKQLVVEAVLERDTSAEPAAVRRALKSVLGSISVEGLAGSVATLRLPKASLLKAVTDLPEVRHVRLPRAATETVVAMPDAKPADMLADSRLKSLHDLGYTGAGLTVTVLASEFPTAKMMTPDKPNAVPELQLLGQKLPAGSRLVDLTAELRPTLDPAPVNPAHGVGGTAAALAVHKAAPKAKILLVRVDPTRFHQILTVAKAVGGEGTFSPALSTRSEELNLRTNTLEGQKRTVTNEVERAFADLTDDPKAVKRRADATAALKQLQADTAMHNTLLERYLAIEGSLELVRRSNVVVNTLVWETGHPHDGESELSQVIERKYAAGGQVSALRASRQAPTPAWVQAGGVSVGSVWSGAFRDADGNRLMEFNDAKAPLAAGRWTKELAFLGYAAAGKPAVLPAGLKLRVTMQWREPHRPEVLMPVEPVHDLKLRLFRQLDPTGQTTATDELAEVAVSQGTPVRLAKTTGSGVYEVTLSVTLPVEGVYALRVEGGRAITDLPAAAKLDAELFPRIVLELTEAGQSAKGKVVFTDVAVQRSGVGIPADSLAAVAVGVGDANGATSATGVGPAIPLGTKPDLLTEGQIAWADGGASGTGVAAGYLGGAAACLMQLGVRPTDLVKTIGIKPGSRFVLPENWLISLSPLK